MRCRRCGTETPRLTPDQRYCPLCIRDMDARFAPKPQPAFTPAWRRRDLSKDLTGVA
jgi:hypothetical protein